MRARVKRLQQSENVFQIVVDLEFGRQNIIYLERVVFFKNLCLLGLRKVLLRIQNTGQSRVTRLEFFQTKIDVSLQRIHTVDRDDSDMLVWPQFRSINFNDARFVGP